ncbi:hypothetical protein EAH89_26560 [Roseomonas nepalensis]|uniref:Uncharacterized protein n=1 Tax=Muricoccus nepalensis TaxID=1854500 RepID=A0A502F426_9PROT|nr:tripartite tricarboxylate transporter substrate-binding protein [Roseomonas nepalensis]TPG44905.1 hypothetical protein EAH89_26560 [Roseomonas nepalensis]
MEASLGTPVAIDNRGGAIGGDFVAKATPDGHTVFLANIASQAMAPRR